MFKYVKEKFNLGIGMSQVPPGNSPHNSLVCIKSRTYDTFGLGFHHA